MDRSKYFAKIADQNAKIAEAKLYVEELMLYKYGHKLPNGRWNADDVEAREYIREHLEKRYGLIPTRIPAITKNYAIVDNGE